MATLGPGGTKSTITCVLAGCYLLIQLVAPPVVMARPAPRSTDFSWDMFSHGLTCSRFDVVARAQGGSWGGVRLDLDFGSWAQVSRVLLAPRLERYASYLCARL